MTSEDGGIDAVAVIGNLRLILTKKGNNYINNIKEIRGILSFFESIFRTRPTAEAFAYLCLNGAATTWLLQVQLEMPEQTAHRAVNILRSKGVVEAVLKLPRIPRAFTRRGGPLPVVWGLAGHWTNEDIARTINLHYRSRSPKYRAAEQVAQSILDECLHLKVEVSYSEILSRVRELRPTLKVPDIAELAAQYLHEKGVKVWR